MEAAHLVRVRARARVRVRVRTHDERRWRRAVGSTAGPWAVKRRPEATRPGRPGQPAVAPPRRRSDPAGPTGHSG
eukprot:scaffold43949_cov50-Phaeocystis_antarctica.AAC.1